MSKKTDFSLSAYKGENKRVHFIGCGGIGTKPLLRIFARMGFHISGSDMEETPALARMRQDLQVSLYSSHGKENLPVCKGEDLLIIYSSAIKEDNPELAEGRLRGARCILRGEALSLLAEMYPKVCAVSGTHGKTTTTALLLHMLKKASYDPGFLVGGNLPGSFWNGSEGNGEIFICEADESDGTHSLIASTCAVMTNLEEDHIWNFSSPEEFYNKSRTFAARSESFIYGEGEMCDALFAEMQFPGRKVKIRKEELAFHRFPRNFGPFLQFNALLAAAAAEELTGKPREMFLAHLPDFPGVERRMSVHWKGANLLLLEDYAHHPSELKAALEAIRSLYGNKKLTLVFQPHRYARLEKYLEEFVSILAQGKDAPEKVFIAPVFAAWTEKGKVNSSLLAEKVGEKAVTLEGSFSEMARKVLSSVEYKGEEEILAIVGAGDICKILPPLKAALEERENDFFRKCGCVFACGGSSSRFGGEENKLLLKLGNLPVSLHAIRNFAPFLKDRMVLVIPEGEEKIYKELLEKYLPEVEITIAYGGSCREESVLNGIKALGPETGYIAIHDGARPFASPALLKATFLAAMENGGGVAARKVTDTIKEADENKLVARTCPRELLYAVQTPQTFRRELLESAFLKGEGRLPDFTDDSSLIEFFTSCRPQLVVDNNYNPKVTYPEDLILAQAFWEKENL